MPFQLGMMTENVKGKEGEARGRRRKEEEQLEFPFFPLPSPSFLKNPSFQKCSA
jgi:hypothetical protein